MTRLSRFRRELFGIVAGAVVALPAIGVAFYDVDLAAWLGGAKFSAHLSPDARPVIARVDSLKRVVRLRAPHHPVWDDTHVGAALRQRDHMFTGEGSTARISFEDGTQVDVGERSLIVVERYSDVTRLEVKRGLIEGSVAKNAGAGRLEVELADHHQILSLKDGRVQVEARRSGEAAVTVLAGVAEIASATAQAAFVLAQNQRSVVKKDGSASKPLTLPMRLVRPAAAWFRAADNVPVVFEWELTAAMRYAVLEVAHDAAFRRVVARREGDSLKRVEASLAPGLYFWRVLVGEDGKRPDSYESSEVRSFTLLDTTPPRLIAPSHEAIIVASQNHHQDKSSAQKALPHSLVDVAFDWKKVSADSYDFELAAKADFAAPLKSVRLMRPPYLQTSLAPGHYFWRVRAQAKQMGEGQWSDIRSFTVEEAPLPVAPKLLAPPDGADFVARDGTVEIPLTWQALRQPASYIAEISGDAAFTQIVATYRTSHPSVNFRPKAPQTFYWRMRAADPYGRPTESSSPRFFSVKPASPELVYPLDAGRLSLAAGRAPSFTWQPTWHADSYVVEVARSANFRDVIVQDETRHSHFEWLTPEPGVFHWRVSARLANGKTLLTSAMRQVELVSTPALQPPVLPDELLAPLEGGAR